MKQLIFSMLLATLFVACDKNPENSPDLTKIRIKERPCETLEYVEKIGNDFETALDSLRKLKSISSEIVKEPLEVLFDYDKRQFFGIIYGDCGMYSDVLDTKGNYYLRTWYCPDENNVDIQEELDWWQPSHSTQWIPPERFLGVCTDELCEYYLQVWKNLFMEKTGYTESYFRKHISVHGSGLEHLSAPFPDFTQFYVTYKIQVDWAFIYQIDVLTVKYGKNYTFCSDPFPDLIDRYLSKEDIKKMPLYNFNIAKQFTDINTNTCKLSKHERLKFNSYNSAIMYLNSQIRIDKYDSYYHDIYIDLGTGDWMLRVNATRGECPILHFLSAKLNLNTGKIDIEGEGKSNCGNI